jgi:hypothetical protein
MVELNSHRYQGIAGRSYQGIAGRSNIQLPTSNEKQTSNSEHSTTPWRGFFSPVLILVTNVLFNSSVCGTLKLFKNLND